MATAVFPCFLQWISYGNPDIPDCLMQIPETSDVLHLPAALPVDVIR